MWEDKYVKIVVKESPSLTPVYLYKDAWGAVLYAKNSKNEVQRYYDDRKEYLEAIRGLKKEINDGLH